MAKKIDDYSAENMLNRLEEKGLIENPARLVDAIIQESTKVKLPWFLYGLIAMGGVIASASYIIALFMIKAISSFLIWGGVFCLSAMILHKNFIKTKHNPFLISFVFSFMCIGKVFIGIGLSEAYDSVWVVAGGLFIVTMLTYPFYEVPIERFLSSYATLSLFLVAMDVDRLFLMDRWFIYEAYVVLQLFILLAVFLLAKGRHALPIVYALILSIGQILMFFGLKPPFIFYVDLTMSSMLFLTLLFKLALIIWLILIIAWAAGGFFQLNQKPLIAACMFTVVLGVIASEGLLFAIGLMILGYAKREQLITLMGILMLIGFLWEYYYFLGGSLFEKSIILVASGLLLLGARFYMLRKGWDKEAVCSLK